MGNLFLASGIVPTRMEAIDPSQFSVVCKDAHPASYSDFGPDGSPVSMDNADGVCHGAASGILGACTELFSRWFSAMRAAIGRERERQAKFKEQSGLPKSAKIPYVKPTLSEHEKAIASISEAVVRAMIGDPAADYARDKFAHAIETGDMRAFKIRLLVLKARDTIMDPVLKTHFSIGADECIDLAEEKAGCKPDNSPRRLSKAEQERKKRLDAIRMARQKGADAQMELPLVWPGQRRTPDIQDIDVGRKEPAAKEAVDSKRLAHDDQNSIYCSGDFSDSNKIGKFNLDESKWKDTDSYEAVTVTGIKRYSNANFAKRKARDYRSADEIVSDIEDGKIVPYASVDEIMSDVELGAITQEDAILFTAALDRYCPDEEEVVSDAEMGPVSDDEDLGEGEFSDGEYYDEDEELDTEDGGERRGETGFSYNPNGFGGCEGGDEDW